MAKIGVTKIDPSGRKTTGSLSAGEIWRQGANAAREKMIASRQALAAQRAGLMRSPGAIGYGQGMQGAAQERLAVTGSLERSLMGLRLKGDASPTSMGASFYGSHGGHKGFYTLNEIDPKVAGKMIGDSASNDDQTQQDARGDKQSEPFGEMYLTRIGMESTDDSNDITVYIYYRIHYFTGEGRCFRVSEEMKQRVKTIPLQAIMNSIASGEMKVADDSGLFIDEHGAIDVVSREGDGWGIHSLTYIDSNGDERVINVFGNEDSELDPYIGTETINELDGDITVTGGSHIRVTTEGSKIIVSYSDDPDPQPDPDPDPDVDPCEHPGSTTNGGVDPSEDDDGSGSSSSAIDNSTGGVTSDEESHTGDNNCNC